MVRENVCDEDAVYIPRRFFGQVPICCDEVRRLCASWLLVRGGRPTYEGAFRNALLPQPHFRPSGSERACCFGFHEPGSLVRLGANLSPSAI